MGRYYPLYYNQLTVAAGTTSPAAVKAYNNKTFCFWSRALFQRMASVLEFDLPEAWQGGVRDFFVWALFYFGFVGISQNDEYGLFFQPCSLSGYDFYYQPTRAIISNPLYQAELKIGEDCEILKLTPDYFGAWDVVEYYAEKLSTLDNAINMSLINNKFAFLWGARNKSAGQALKKMLDLVNKGEPAVVWDMKLLNDPTDKEPPFQELRRDNLKDSYLTTDQLADFQTIINNFDAEIGIPTVPYHKKERLVTEEATSREIDAKARSIVWFDSLTSSLSKVKELYPEAASIRIKLRYDTEGEEANNVSE